MKSYLGTLLCQKVIKVRLGNFDRPCKLSKSDLGTWMALWPSGPVRGFPEAGPVSRGQVGDVVHFQRLGPVSRGPAGEVAK